MQSEFKLSVTLRYQSIFQKNSQFTDLILINIYIGLLKKELTLNCILIKIWNID